MAHDAMVPRISFFITYFPRVWKAYPGLPPNGYWALSLGTFPLFPSGSAISAGSLLAQSLRIDVIQTSTGQLLLTEIENLCPYLYLLEVHADCAAEFLMSLRASMAKAFHPNIEDNLQSLG